VDVDAVHAEEFDGVLVPAGFRRNHFRTHERFLSLLRDLYALGKPLAALHDECWALIPGGVPRASWPAVKRALIVEPGPRRSADAFGAQPVKSGPPGDIDGLVGAFVGELDRRSAGAASSSAPGLS
jgi:putative intracellular protease/amidase